MDRKGGIPVGVPGQPVGNEVRRLGEPRPLWRRFNLVLEPGATGYPHVGPQAEEPRPLERLDSPEIDNIPNPETRLVSASEPHPDAAYQPIDERVEALER